MIQRHSLSLVCLTVTGHVYLLRTLPRTMTARKSRALLSIWDHLYLSSAKQQASPRLTPRSLLSTSPAPGSLPSCPRCLLAPAEGFCAWYDEGLTRASDLT